MLHPSAPATRSPVKVAGGIDSLRGFAGGGQPAGACCFAPVAGGVPYGQNAVQEGMARYPGCSDARPVIASYLGGLFPAFALGATAAATYQITTNSRPFLGFKFLVPDTLMGVGHGVNGITVAGVNYLDVASPVPLECFDALWSDESHARIDLCWLQNQNSATVALQPIAAGLIAATPAYPTALQGVAVPPGG